VVHSLFIPAYRIKEDCVPGMETHLWFLPDEVGSYDLFCSEYCGVGHSAMITKVEVMTEKEFNAWYQGEAQKASGPGRGTVKKKEPTGIDAAKLIELKGCLACHSLDGSAKIGPTLKGVLGKKEVVTVNGKEVEIIVDDAFIKKKILEPEKERVKGFPPIMPSQKDLLTEKEIDAITQYLRTLK
jgi:cytochrome c oxidase subunit 2